jgi:hypothetical protein
VIESDAVQGDVEAGQNANVNDWRKRVLLVLLAVSVQAALHVQYVDGRTGDREGRQRELGGRPDQDTARVESASRGC